MDRRKLKPKRRPHQLGVRISTQMLAAIEAIAWDDHASISETSARLLGLGIQARWRAQKAQQQETANNAAAAG